MTAIATGSGSIGVRLVLRGHDHPPGSYTLDLKNTIASGESADVWSPTAGKASDGPGNIVVSNSSFDHPEQKVHGGTVTDSEPAT